MKIKMYNKAWWKEAVIYQIYPRSFMDSNGDGVGDLQGIISRLDYLKNLGVDVLWLSPIYKSPNDDNGYDISDYRDIMDEFGTIEDFDALIAQAHKRGLKIMMDLVVNHTSDEHEWFINSKSSKDNPYRDYYIWREGVEGGPPNNWGACFGGSAWEYEPERDMYYLHLFSKKQPDLNWDNEKVRQEVYDMMSWWCEKGVDGFRMDVINMISKTKEMPNGSLNDAGYGNFGDYCLDGPNIHKYLREMNDKVLSKYELITVGETPAVDVDKASLYTDVSRKELNMVFQFEHMDIGAKYGKWTDEKVPMDQLKETLNRWQVGMEDKGWNSLYWNNHDQPRVVSRFGNDSELYREKSAKMLATCLHMMQGTPYIYQGEELGMTNYPFEHMEQFRDIESINAYEEWVESGKLSHETMMTCLKIKSRDNARTPIQWTDERNGGFTKGTPWIDVNPNTVKINAKEQETNPDSVYNFYRRLIKLRKTHPIIVYGKFTPIASVTHIYAYERSYEINRMVVVCNFSEQTTTMDRSVLRIDSSYKVLIANQEVILDRDETKDVEITPYGCVVFYQ